MHKGVRGSLPFVSRASPRAPRSARSANVVPASVEACYSARREIREKQARYFGRASCADLQSADLQKLGAETHEHALSLGALPRLAAPGGQLPRHQCRGLAPRLLDENPLQPVLLGTAGDFAILTKAGVTTTGAPTH
eukprot:scaffold49210_cov66-Phaeocystis_antarctica.AAC.1